MSEKKTTKKRNLVPKSPNIFIVHGHDKTMKTKVADFVGSLNLTPVILDKQVNRGETVIEKFEENASECEYAIVLMSEQDDRGCARENVKKEGALKPRARQNVVLELGYFLGKLGRERICIITHGYVDIPSDISNVVHIKYAPNSNKWKTALNKELIAAQYTVPKYTAPRKRRKTAKKAGARAK